MRTLQQIQEGGDDGGIDQVGKHGADDGDNEERLDGVAVFIANSTHVSHRIGSGTKTEATKACAEDSGIIVAPQKREGYKEYKEPHHDNLGHEDDDQGQGKTLQLP